MEKRGCHFCKFFENPVYKLSILGKIIPVLGKNERPKNLILRIIPVDGAVGYPLVMNASEDWR